MCWCGLIRGGDVRNKGDMEGLSKLSADSNQDPTSESRML